MAEAQLLARTLNTSLGEGEEPLPLDGLAAALSCLSPASRRHSSPAEAYQDLVKERFTGVACLDAQDAKLVLIVADGVALGAHLEKSSSEHRGSQALAIFEGLGGPVELAALRMSVAEILGLA